MTASVAHLAGFVRGFTAPAAQAASVWVFLAALSVATLACVTAWQTAWPASLPATTLEPSAQ